MSDALKALFHDYLCAFMGENILLVVIMWVLLGRPTPSGLCLICMDDGSLDPIPTSRHPWVFGVIKRTLEALKDNQCI